MSLDNFPQTPASSSIAATGSGSRAGCGHAINHNTCITWSIWALRKFSPIIGLFSGLTFMGASCAAAGRHKWLCKVFQSSTIISFGFGSFWMLKNVADNASCPTSYEKKLRNHPLIYTIVRHILIQAFSIINTAIPAYISYAYNDNNPWFLIISIPVSYEFNIFAFHMISEINHYRWAHYWFTHRGIQTPHLFDTLRNIEIEKQQLLTHSAYQPVNQDEGDDSVTHTQDASLQYSKYYRISTQTIFLLFPFVNMLVNLELSKATASIVTSNTFLHGFFVFLMVSTALIIDCIFGVLTAGILYDSFERKILKNPPNDYMSSRAKKISKVTLLATFFLATLSSSGRIHIAKTTIHKLFLAICVGVNATIFEWYTQRDLTGQCLESATVQLKGNDAPLIKQLWNLNSKTRLIRSSDPYVLKNDPGSLNTILAFSPI